MQLEAHARSDVTHHEVTFLARFLVQTKMTEERRCSSGSLTTLLLCRQTVQNTEELVIVKTRVPSGKTFVSLVCRSLDLYSAAQC